MPELSHRAKTLESLSRSSIHQSLATPGSHVAMARCRTSTLNDPVQAMEMLRSLVQPSINEEIKKVLQKFVDTYFNPAAKNARSNLGEIGERLVDDVCVSALENAKAIFSSIGADKAMAAGKTTDKRVKKAKKKQTVTNRVTVKKRKIESKVLRPNNDLILVSKTGKPVRREGTKWEPQRLSPETIFILGSRANKALGFGQTRGRLYIKHPELFKYSGDQEDKEWLAKNHVMTTTGGKAYLMVLSDIIELARSPDYVSHPRQQPNELIGFTVPSFIVAKMKRFMSTVKTDPTIPDSDLIKEGEAQIARWEEERKKLVSLSFASSHNLNMAEFKDSMEQVEDADVQEILDEMKTESDEHDEEGTTNDNEDELGFLHGMNLTNLVREFEMEAATGNGSQHLAILSLADDNAEGAFPELPDDGEEEPVANMEAMNG